LGSGVSDSSLCKFSGMIVDYNIGLRIKWTHALWQHHFNSGLISALTLTLCISGMDVEQSVHASDSWLHASAARGDMTLSASLLLRRPVLAYN
jgi:hypothetical protein